MKIIKSILEKIILIIAVVLFAANTINFMSNKLLHSNYVNVLGYTYFFIDSDNMVPDINVGNMIIVKITDDVKEGDIVTYYINKEYKTSKVSKIEDESITVKDNNNPENSTKVIVKEQIVGKMARKINDGQKIKKYMSNKLLIKWLVLLMIVYLIVSVIDVIIDKIIKDIKNRPAKVNNSSRFIKK